VYGTAINLSGLGVVAYMRGDLRKAEAYYLRALKVRESLYPGSIGVARNLDSLSQIAWKQGDLESAEKYGVRALQMIERQAPDTSFAAEIYTTQGHLAESRRDFIKAEDYFQKALVIDEKAGTDNLTVADILNNLGKVRWERQDLPQAEKLLSLALAIVKKVAPDCLCVADSLNLLGNVLHDRNDLVQAKEYYSQALAIREKLAPGSPDDVESLVALASLMRQTGQSDAAAQLYQQALNAVEKQIPRQSGKEEVRSGFRAQYTGYYKSYIDLLVTRNQPEHAFFMLERLRARSFLEMLSQARVDIRKGIDPALVQKEQTLEESINAKSMRRLELLGQPYSDQQVATLDKEIEGLLADYKDTEGQIRSSSPVYAALTQPQPLNAKQVQQQLLKADTVLLEYSLGEEHSYVFALTPASLHVYELPKRSDIEAAARSVYDLLTVQKNGIAGETGTQRQMRLRQADKEYALAVAELGRLVLTPVAGELGGKRILIVSDGALQYIPFAAVPVPSTDDSGKTVPLVAEHEIVNLPSASVLAVLRRQHTEHNPGSRMVAVLADPVFTSQDDRLQVASVKSQSVPDPPSRPVSDSAAAPVAASSIAPDDGPRDLDRSAKETGIAGGVFSRLPFSRREAEAIHSVAGKDNVFEALDFDASKTNALDSRLKDYRIVHFATHGLLNNDHPELSGLVFSLVDKTGKSQDGFLRLLDIYNMELNADLVVLSACQTALGKEVGEEGLMGLTRGFMYAGAPRVVASLWKVDDEATAALMKKFYEGLLRDHQTPAQALRSAQQWMRTQKNWQSPYYWAGFVLQGEWN
jgi:CHAT domain-containing protein/Tfp pilus assembly protein PilF